MDAPIWDQGLTIICLGTTESTRLLPMTTCGHLRVQIARAIYRRDKLDMVTDMSVFRPTVAAVRGPITAMN